MARKQNKNAVARAANIKKKASAALNSQGKIEPQKASRRSPSKPQRQSRSTTDNVKSARPSKNQQPEKKQPLPSTPTSSEDEESLPMPSDKENVRDTRQVKLGGNKIVHQETERESVEEDSDNDDDAAADDDDDHSDHGNDANKGKTAGFTDENSKWLKLKQKESTKPQAQLLSSDDEDDDAVEGDEFDVDKEFEDNEGEGEDEKEEDDDDDDDDEELEVERQSRRLDEEILAQKAEAEQELRRTIAENTEIFHLPTKEELEKDSSDRVVPPSEIKARVESVMEVLADFKNRREEGRSRSEYVDQLISDIAELHGYLSELVEYFHSMFGPSETIEFVDASDKPRPLVIRTNTLKARRKDLAAALMKRGVTLDPLATWSKVGLKIIESPVPIGATPEYLSGMYMLQSAASMCPVMALSPQQKEKVLDMSAAPGGKTSYIAQLMRNTGVIFANDLKAERQKATVANLHRLGVKNVVASAHDGRKLGKVFRNRFDRVLLDAPCSGLGVISRDPSVKIQRTIVDVQNCAHLQKELLLAAIDALNHKSKTGGVMVYSTCSVSVAENEEVVNYALSKRDIKIIDTGLDFGKPGFTRYQQKRFHPSVALTRRFYPHVHNMDGFYVAKIQKLSDKRPDESLVKPTTNDDNEGEVENDHVEDDVNDDGIKDDESSEDEENHHVVHGRTKRKRSQDAANTENYVKSSNKKKPRPEENSQKKRGSISSNKESTNSPNSKPVHNLPPKTSETKKKRLNAKVTKPRRPKASSMI